jgi:hypothetical protein
MCNHISTNSEIRQENLNISIWCAVYRVCQGAHLSRKLWCNARANWETTPLVHTLRGVITRTGSRKCLPYSGWNRGIKICICTVLHSHLLVNQPPSCYFCVVLCILSHAVLRESFPGFETKCVVSLLFALPCTLCHCSCILYSALWLNVQRD